MHTVFGIAFCDSVGGVTDQRQMLLARAAGFEATELVLGEPSFKARVHAARAAGVCLTFARMLPDYVNALWGDKELWPAFHAYYTERLAEAKAEGFETVTVATSQGAPIPRVSQRGLDHLRELAADAERMGVRLLFENGESEEHFEVTVRNVCRGFHGVAFRPSVRARVMRTSAVPRYALPHLKTVVLDDIVRDKDGYIPYDGETDFTAVYESLASISYRGVFLSRINPARGGYMDRLYESLASATYESLLRFSRCCYKKEGIIP